MRVAFAHDWLVARRGGEQVLRTLAAQWPSAEIYTLVADRRTLPPELRSRTLHTSWLQWVLGRRAFRLALPLFPSTIEAFTVRNADLVVSISHAVAKGIRAVGVPHLCYCLTPMRYTWVEPERYFGPAARQPGSMAHRLVESLKAWDAASARRVDRFIAISRTVQARIKHCYGRDADVIYPPVDCAPFEAAARDPQPYALVVSALVPYKRADLAVEAFTRLKRPLVVIGDGPEAGRLRRIAGPMVRFLPWQSPEALARWYAGARALIYPQAEDFGIAAVEAQAAGCPVVALRRGGAVETVLDGVTGLFFEAQTADALIDAVERLDRLAVDPSTLRRHARTFDRAVFEQAFRAAMLSMRGAQA